MAAHHSTTTRPRPGARRGSAFVRVLIPLGLLVGVVVFFIILNEQHAGSTDPGSERNAEQRDEERRNGARAAADASASDTAGDGPDASVEQRVDDDGSEPDNSPNAEFFTVRMGGETFQLERALTREARFRGLSFRDSIPRNGGMVFAFPEKRRQAFVMRDCLVPIDIAYVDDDGRVVNMYTMRLEPRRAGEDDATYERRLTRYSSAEPVRLVLEFRSGTFARLGVKRGDRIDADFFPLILASDPTF